MWANNWIGMLLGIVVCTPMKQWRRGHNYHHQNSGNLSIVSLQHAIKAGDTIFFTRAQWDSMPWGTQKVMLRVVRDPVVFFTVVPFLLFFIAYRIPGRYTRANTWGVTIGKAVEVGLITWAFPAFLWMELFALWMTAICGVMLFHLQHGANQGYRAPASQYNDVDAALMGATYLEFVPWWAKWATLGIEYHHIHHLNTRVPCYKLQKCHEEADDGLWDDVNHVGAVKAWKSLFNVMWNEETGLYEPF
jgi:omega-6 fatty acid desaturase (delta-12 desaturase)